MQYRATSSGLLVPNHGPNRIWTPRRDHPIEIIDPLRMPPLPDVGRMPPLQCAVAFDAASNGGSVVGTGVTFAHTMSAGPNGYIAVLLSRRVGTVTGITYAGVVLTQRVVSGADSGGYHSEIWDLVAPASGANNVIITMSTTSNLIAGAISATGVDQTTPRTDGQGGTGISASPNETVNSAVGELVISQFRAGAALTLDAAFTETWSLQTNFVKGAYIAGASSTVTRTDSCSSAAWTAVMASLKAAAAGGGGTPTLPLTGVGRDLALPIAGLEWLRRRKNRIRRAA